MSDERVLILRCLRGETEAWRAFVEAYGPTVYDAARYTLRRVLGGANETEIENVYQSVFLALCDRNFRRLRSFQGRSALRTWLTAATSRFALNHIRTEKRKGSLKLAPLDPGLSETIERDEIAALPPEEKEQLFHAIDRLPAREKLLVKLFYFEALPYKAIAALMRMPVNSISPLLSRAKEQLRAAMKAKTRL